MIKSDTIITPSLKTDFVGAFDKLESDQSSSRHGLNWRPGNSKSVIDLVDPNLYPFVFERSRFIQEEVVGVVDSICKWSGKGERVTLLLGDAGVLYWWDPDFLWSKKAQWLPSNLEVGKDGKVTFTSYVNDLHPVKCTAVYRMLERLINEAAIPAWNVVLYGPKSGKRFGHMQRWIGNCVEEYGVSEEGNFRILFAVSVGLWEDLDLRVLEEFEAEHGPIPVKYQDGDEYANPFGEEENIQKETWRIEPNDACKYCLSTMDHLGKADHQIQSVNSQGSLQQPLPKGTTRRQTQMANNPRAYPSRAHHQLR